MKEIIYETFSPEETRALGKKIGEESEAGAVYTLVGDLGVGKTVFTQGIAEGLGIEEPICSPTFTIVQVMKKDACRFTISMFTVSATSKKWMRLATRITFLEKVSA